MTEYQTYFKRGAVIFTISFIFLLGMIIFLVSEQKWFKLNCFIGNSFCIFNGTISRVILFIIGFFWSISIILLVIGIIKCVRKKKTIKQQATDLNVLDQNDLEDAVPPPYPYHYHYHYDSHQPQPQPPQSPQQPPQSPQQQSPQEQPPQPPPQLQQSTPQQPKSADFLDSDNDDLYGQTSSYYGLNRSIYDGSFSHNK